MSDAEKGNFKRFKVLDLLNRDELDELEKFAREPGRTIDECHEWLLSRGFKISRNAAWRWLADFREQIVKERFSVSGELARAIKSAVSDGSVEDIADGAAMQLIQVVFEQASMLQANDEIDPLTLQRMTRSLLNLTGAKREIESLKSKVRAAVAEAEKSADAGASTGDVISKVREILGVDAPPRARIGPGDIAGIRQSIFGASAGPPSAHPYANGQ